MMEMVTFRICLLSVVYAGILCETSQQSPDSETHISKAVCKPLQTYPSSALKSNITAPNINRTSLGSVLNSEVCGGLCCEMESCDMAEFNNHHCYAIQCPTLNSCQIAPNTNSEILTFSRKTGTELLSRGSGEATQNKTRNTVDHVSTVTKSLIPANEAGVTAEKKDSIISTSAKVDTPMEQLLKEELNLVRQKELEKEKNWSLSEIQSKKDQTSSLGKEIQSITGEHYLKAEDKSDITALQENDTLNAHSKLHEHRRDLRHTLISPITIGAFTCMTVIAVSGFAMAIIKYKNDRKDMEDKQTQSP